MPYIPDHPCRILIIGGSGSGKTNTLLNLINEQKGIDKIYLYAKDLSEAKYEHLIRNYIDKFSKYIAEKETDIDEELSTRYFGFQKSSDIFNSLIDTNDIEKNNKLVVSIIGVLKDFKEKLIRCLNKKEKLKSQIK